MATATKNRSDKAARDKAAAHLRAVKAVDPVGTSEIAERLGVETRTVNQWRFRAEAIGFPEARWLVGNGPAWDWSADVLPWAQATGRV